MSFQGLWPDLHVAEVETKLPLPFSARVCCIPFRIVFMPVWEQSPCNAQITLFMMMRGRVLCVRPHNEYLLLKKHIHLFNL
jgi:hypothetical protein